jgi:hypothetical protein
VSEELSCEKSEVTRVNIMAVIPLWKIGTAQAEELELFVFGPDHNKEWLISLAFAIVSQSRLAFVRCTRRLLCL